MGQFSGVSSPGITVTPIDRETGPGAGAGTSGNLDIYLGQHAGDNSTLDSNIVIGHNAQSGGATDNAHLNGQIVIGVNAAALWNSGAGSGAETDAGNIVIGLNAAQNVADGVSNVVIGTHALETATGAGGLTCIDNVIIGAFAAQNPLNRVNQSVVIGWRAGRGGTTPGVSNFGITASVIIGSEAAPGANALSLNAVIVIGTGAATQLGSGSTTVTTTCIVGTNSVQTLITSTDNTFIGNNVTCQPTCVGLTVLGAGAEGGQDRNTVIGANAGLFNGGGGRPGSRCIVIGAFAGIGASPSQANDLLVVETFDTSSAKFRSMFYGSLETGELIVGNWNHVLSRTFPGTPNALILYNTPAGAGGAFADGGYFYVTAGALHWVGSGGTDTPLAPA